MPAKVAAETGTISAGTLSSLPEGPVTVLVHSHDTFGLWGPAQTLTFNGGGDIATLRVRGGGTGESFLVMENPSFKNGRGELVASEVSGGRAKVE